MDGAITIEFKGSRVTVIENEININQWRLVGCLEK